MVRIHKVDFSRQISRNLEKNLVHCRDCLEDFRVIKLSRKRTSTVHRVRLCRRTCD